MWTLDQIKMSKGEVGYQGSRLIMEHLTQGNCSCACNHLTIHEIFNGGNLALFYLEIHYP